MTRLLRSLTLLACISAATAFGAQLAMADGGAGSGKGAAKCGEQRRHEGHRGQHFLKKLAKELGLSEQQKSQAKALLDQSREQNRPVRTAVMQERRQMRALILSGTADEGAIRAQSAKIAAAQADLSVLRAKEAKQLLALLTPEQKSKLNTIMEKREQKFQGFMNHDEHPLP